MYTHMYIYIYIYIYTYIHIYSYVDVPACKRQHVSMGTTGAADDARCMRHMHT